MEYVIGPGANWNETHLFLSVSIYSKLFFLWLLYVYSKHMISIPDPLWSHGNQFISLTLVGKWSLIKKIIKCIPIDVIYFCSFDEGSSVQYVFRSFTVDLSNRVRSALPYFFYIFFLFYVLKSSHISKHRKRVLRLYYIKKAMEERKLFFLFVCCLW